MTLPKLTSASSLSVIAVIVLVFGLVIAVVGSQQQTNNSSHAAGIAVGDPVLTNKALSVTSNAGVTATGLTVGATYDIKINGTFKFNSDSSADPMNADAQWIAHNCKTCSLSSFTDHNNAININGSQPTSKEGTTPANSSHAYNWSIKATSTSMKIFMVDSNYSDNTGGLTVNMKVGALPANKPPVVNAGADKTITLPTSTVTLTGTATDSDGTIKTILWTKTSGPAATISSPSTVGTKVTGLVQGTYVFTLKATDNAGASASDAVTIKVMPAAANVPPVANAGPPQVITLPDNSVDLRGSGTDSDGTIKSYAWTKASGGAATITTPTAAATSVTGLVVGTYTFKLTVTDNGGATGTDTVTVTVNPADQGAPPTVNAGKDQTITLPTSTVTLAGTATPVAPAQITTYLWTQTGGPTGAVLTNPNQKSTTVTGLTEGTYEFTLKATDSNGLSGLGATHVTVNTAANKLPVITIGGPQTITLPTIDTTVTGSATDSDGTIVSYLWTQLSGPVQATILSPDEPTTTIADLTAAGVYVFNLQVTDNDGGVSNATLTITVNAASTKDTLLKFDILLDGVGNGGDSVNPNGGGGNKNPIHKQRTLDVQVINSDQDGNDQIVAENQNGLVTYNDQTGTFQGTINMSTDPNNQLTANGTYGLVVKLKTSLKNKPKLYNIVVGTTNVVPQIRLINGDVNNDGFVSINIDDYNILQGCYSDFTPPTDCPDQATKDEADLNDDGNVNFADLNLFLRELNTIN